MNKFLNDGSKTSASSRQNGAATSHIPNAPKPEAIEIFHDAVETISGESLPESNREEPDIIEKAVPSDTGHPRAVKRDSDVKSRRKRILRIGFLLEKNAKLFKRASNT